MISGTGPKIEEDICHPWGENGIQRERERLPQKNKDNGGDSIQDELFKILQDDAVNVLHLICKQIWKIQQ